MPQTLAVAVCICDEVTLSDFIPPMEILSFFNLADYPVLPVQLGDVPYRVKIDYLAPTMNPVVGAGSVSPTVNPTQTYAAALQSGVQYDIIWVPAGPFPDLVTGKDRTPLEEIEFVKQQAPGAKYIMSVCGGSLILAAAGLLDGKRATTNKMFYRNIVAAASKSVKWVPKARWVIDGNIWTSSGVTAGSDMAIAFVEHLTGPKLARQVRGMVEINECGGSEDDPFAAFHGLV
ncbi:class I glutamine amidotransferase-like protein [Ramaria rubella]|nr:class I glutamine amidotransferase-like protein [Ramaria rubella]